MSDKYVVRYYDLNVSPYQNGHYSIIEYKTNELVCIVPEAIGGQRNDDGRNVSTLRKIELIISKLNK